MAGITAIGSDWEQVERSLRANLSGVAYMSDWDRFEEINTRLGGPVKDFSLPSHYTRKVLRTMGRLSQMSVRPAELAMHDAGLIGDPEIGTGVMGVSYGSCTGSTDAVREFVSLMITGQVRPYNPTTYLTTIRPTRTV